MFLSRYRTASQHTAPFLSTDKWIVSPIVDISEVPTMSLHKVLAHTLTWIDMKLHFDLRGSY